MKTIVAAALCLLLAASPMSAYWHVVSITYVGNLNGAHNPFSFPSEYTYNAGAGVTVSGTSQSGIYQCPKQAGNNCDTQGSLAFNVATCNPSCTNLSGHSCGTDPPAGWDEAAYLVPMPMSASTPTFINPASGTAYRWMMFHMGQAINGCPGTSGVYGSIGIDFSTNGATDWFQPAGQNPVLTDLYWSQAPLNFPSGSSVEKAGGFYRSGTYYLMGIVPTLTAGYDNTLSCSNTSSLSYIVSSTSLSRYTWNRVTAPGNSTGKVSTSGFTYPPNSVNYYGPWLLNVEMKYDPATDYVYMTRAYKMGTACNLVTNPFPLPDRIQVYRVAGGLTGALTGTWELLVDLGCNTTAGTYPYQQTLSIVPDAAQIKHDGLGNVVFNSDGGITLVISNGNTETLDSCAGTASVGIYEVKIAP